MRGGRCSAIFLRVGDGLLGWGGFVRGQGEERKEIEAKAKDWQMNDSTNE